MEPIRKEEEKGLIDRRQAGSVSIINMLGLGIILAIAGFSCSNIIDHYSGNVHTTYPWYIYVAGFVVGIILWYLPHGIKVQKDISNKTENK